MRVTKVLRTELGHKYILVECSVIALCLPVVSKLSRYKLVCYKKNNDRYEHKTYLCTKLMPCSKTFREIHPWFLLSCVLGVPVQVLRCSMDGLSLQCDQLVFLHVFMQHL